MAFLGATVFLILLVGGSAYFGLRNYFNSSADLSLLHGMATQFQLYGFTLPPQLDAAENTWFDEQGAERVAVAAPAQVAEGDTGDALEDIEQSAQLGIGEGREETYSSDIILVFVMPLDEQGNLLFNPNPYPLPMDPNVAASQAALQNGSDLRDAYLPTGQRLRLLSYRTQSGQQPAVLQVGRLLEDQDRVLLRVATSIGVAGLALIALVGAGSWWLAGRTLVPAQQAWDRQQTFVANASHELRTPLTLMRASTEVAMRQKAGPKRNRLLQDVLSETDYMSRLVDDLLLLSRLDGGRLQLALEPLAVNALLADVRAQAAKLPGGSTVAIKNESRNANVMGDRTRLRQVLLILLDNALGHNPPGTPIQVTAHQQGDRVEISVQDQGKGISPGYLEHLFERFYQIPSEAGAGRGHGLGLSIAKGLVELHNGTIRADSALGEGTTFTISLPAAKTPAA